MARINIEDSIYRDERFHRLSVLEGGKAKALGLCVIAWDLAHRWFLKHPEGLVPIHAWESEADLYLLEKYNLAERRENGIYVKGTKDKCEYLTERRENGKKGGLKTKENFSSKLKQIKQTQPSTSTSVSKSIKDLSSPPGTDLEKLYEGYPRRGRLDMGKAVGMKRLTRLLKNGELDLETAKRAIDNYAASCRKHQIKNEKIKMFSTFFGEGEAWREYGAQISLVPKPEDEEAEIKIARGY